jgi:hypothetical protein
MAFNLTNVSSIVGMTSATIGVATTGTTIVGAPATNHTYKVNSVLASNKTNAAATVTLALNRASTWSSLAFNVSVPSYSTLVLVGKDTPFYMLDTTSDILSATASTSSAIDILASYEDIS